MKLISKITRDGWTCEKTLCLLNDNGLPIWASKPHLHEFNQELLQQDIKFIIEKYKLDESIKYNIEEVVSSGRVT